MDFLATPLRRRLLFACLYFSEGAPIGFIWVALPTRLRASGVPLEQITWLTALLVLPWTFKFAWAPLVDVLRTRRWTLRHWVVASQTMMGLTLLPLVGVDPQDNFGLLAGLLLAHALAAATQDVAIDALCISVTDPAERGRYNGWMQAGMLLGRSLLGGGSLVVAGYVGDQTVLLLLILATTFSAVLVVLARVPETPESGRPTGGRIREVLAAARQAVRQRNTWVGLLFALLGGAAYESLYVVMGPYLLDLGYTQKEVGWFSAGPMILCMIAGSISGGWLADRLGCKRFVAIALLFFVTTISTLATTQLLTGGARGAHVLGLLAVTAFGIGLFTAASYALFMDITLRGIEATQFSAFMGATNGCEAWSSYTIGRLIVWRGYSAGMLIMCAASLIALPLLAALDLRRRPAIPAGDDPGGEAGSVRGAGSQL